MSSGDLRLAGVSDASIAPVLDRLVQEDVLGQLLTRTGRAATLAMEDSEPKLDWVDGVELALAHPAWLASVAQDAAAIVADNIHDVIWAGMGGSVQTVQCLRRLGYLQGPRLDIHPLNSTDPAALNDLLASIAARSPDAPAARDRPPPAAVVAALRPALQTTLMLGVSMGITSEEPITHLRWFNDVLTSLDVPDPARHFQVMTLPGSYLDDFARSVGAPVQAIQLDGASGTPGRMSAPATRVFLLPLALALAAAVRYGGLSPAHFSPAAFTGRLLGLILARGQALYGVRREHTQQQRAVLIREHPCIRLGAFLAQAAAAGRNKVVLLLPPTWAGLAPWVEQLFEESLGKGGKGLLIFYDQDPAGLDRFGPDCLFLEISPEGLPHEDAAISPIATRLREMGREVLSLHVRLRPEPLLPTFMAGIGELAGLFLGLKLTVATFACLQDIVFAGQPAVEAYKTYAREAREDPGRIGYPDSGPELARTGSVVLSRRSLLARQLLSDNTLSAEVAQLGATSDDAAAVLASILRIARRQGWLCYVDLTWNGLLTSDIESVLQDARQTLINGALGLPGKVRTGPADYHSTEQSQTDGPAELISIRLIARQHEPMVAGTYDDTFLHAQAHGTWQAMEDAGRWVLMAWLPNTDRRSLDDLAALFGRVAKLVAR